jgi:hypothetical protein
VIHFIYRPNLAFKESNCLFRPDENLP